MVRRVISLCCAFLLVGLAVRFSAPDSRAQESGAKDGRSMEINLK